MGAKGILYGIGVGPGDPELMTVKAVKIIKSCEVIGIPARDRTSCTAYSIVESLVPELDKREVVSVPVPMTTDINLLNNAYDEGAGKICEILNKGKNIAFLNLGDPTIYGSYMSVHERVISRGYEASIVSGVPSFCAVAAALSTYVGLRDNAIHIFPGQKLSDGDIVRHINEGDSLIIMKSGNEMQKLRDSLVMLSEQGILDAMAVVNCGMPNEQIYEKIEDISPSVGYFTTILVHPRRRLG